MHEIPTRLREARPIRQPTGFELLSGPMSVVIPPNVHRPWPHPKRPWQVAMCWRELAFLHWPVTPDTLRPFIPEGLSIDTFDGKAWLGVVPFLMDVKPRFLPRVPSFPELNVRTYVTAEEKPGVWFFSLDAASPLAVKVGRRFFDLPYFTADMSISRSESAIRYESRRAHRGAPPARFAARYQPTGEPFEATKGSLEYFLVERYCLYSSDRKGRLYRVEVGHAPWKLRTAECRIEANSLTERLGVSTFGQAPIAHYSDRIDVVSWNRRRVL